MNSKVIKFVAGAGKTTYAQNYIQENKNGLYLAFNNSVVNEIKNKGFLSKTIDSLFVSYIIPKFISITPLISNGSKISYINNVKLPAYLKGVANIRIDISGNILNQKTKTQISMNTLNKDLHRMSKFPNSSFIQYIFGKDELKINDELRANLSYYLINNYPDKIIDLLSSRFDYIIIDEAQDLKGYREKFAELIYNSQLKLILLGDDNQNINGGGIWFQSLPADETKQESFRCPDFNCNWIRNNLKINIIGNKNQSKYELINFNEVLKYDDGSRTLLYVGKIGKNVNVINNWTGPKNTIKGSKGETIDNDIVIIGEKISIRNYYTAITRTTKNVYSTIRKYE